VDHWAPYCPARDENLHLLRRRARRPRPSRSGHGCIRPPALPGCGCVRRSPPPPGPDHSGTARPARSSKYTESYTAAIVAEAGKALVLAPDTETAVTTAREVAQVDWPVMTIDYVSVGIEPFAATVHATCGLARRYDGLDMPGNACRVVVLEGKPDQDNLQERFRTNRDSATTYWPLWSNPSARQRSVRSGSRPGSGSVVTSPTSSPRQPSRRSPPGPAPGPPRPRRTSHEQ